MQTPTHQRLNPDLLRAQRHRHALAKIAAGNRHAAAAASIGYLRFRSADPLRALAAWTAAAAGLPHNAALATAWHRAVLRAAAAARR